MRKNRRGASLILVVFLFAFVFIVGLGVMTVAGTSSGQTNVAQTQRQADLTAQSILDAVVAKVKDTTINPATSSGWITGSDPKLGGFKYSISDVSSSIGPNSYKVSVEAWYPNTNGSHSKMNRIIQGTVSSYFIPGMLAQSTGANPNKSGDTFGVGTMDGDLILNENGASVTLGNTTQSTTGNVYVNGTLNLTGSYVVSKNVYATGDVNVYSRVDGNVYAIGKANANGQNNCWGTIGGTAYSNDQRGKFTYTTPTNWTVSSSDLQSMTQNKKSITIDQNNSYTVNQSCTLTLQTGNSWGAPKLTFDTSQGDLYIMLYTNASGKQTINLPSGLDMLVSGGNDVYLFLDDLTANQNNYADFNVSSNCFLGSASYPNGVGVPTTNPGVQQNLYIISNKASSIYFTSNSSLNGYIYTPYGSVAMDGDGVVSGTGIKLYGAIIASEMNLGASTKYIYFGTKTQSGGGSSGTVNWTGTNCKVLGTYAGN